jgi:hypothetical protein
MVDERPDERRSRLKGHECASIGITADDFSSRNGTECPPCRTVGRRLGKPNAPVGEQSVHSAGMIAPRCDCSIERLIFTDENADFRRGVTCLIYTQFSPGAGRFFPVFSAFERLDLGAV